MNAAMTPDTLDTLSDSALNALFAVEVDGWTAHPALMHTEFSRGAEWLTDAPRYCQDANLLLPHLYRRHWEVNQTSLADRPIRVRLDDACGPFGEADTFPRAAVIALIRAARADC